MYDDLEIPEFLKRAPETPEQAEARRAQARTETFLAPSSRLDYQPSEQSKKRQAERDERERQATIERWEREYLAEKIAERKRGRS